MSITVDELVSKERLSRRILDVHPQTLMRWVREEKFPPPIVPFPGSKTLRWRLSDVEAWLKKCAHEAS
tara:strand:+ start:42 stop:245 length:204 start_codon:yes stop_codon:yes gene_type:complete